MTSRVAHERLPQKGVRLHAPVHVTGTYYGYADGIRRRHPSARSISREKAVITKKKGRTIP